VLKTYALITTLIYSAALTLVCLVPLNGVIKVNITLGDKIFHAVTYMILSFLWYLTFYYNLNSSKTKALMYAMLVSITFGIIIEILQGTITAYRSADINDVIANTIGVLIMSVVMVIKNKSTVN
jgi:VanZ family protein